LKISKGGLTI